MKYLIMLLAALPAPAAHDKPQKKPGHPFLQYPIIHMGIESARTGCKQYNKDMIDFDRSNDSVLISRIYETYRRGEGKRHRCKTETDLKELRSILARMLADSGYSPNIKDFVITEADKGNYLQLLKETDIAPYGFYEPTVSKKDYSIHLSAPERLDTIGKASLERILAKGGRYNHTTRCWFTTTLINSNSDTLEISHHYSVEASAWQLPWEVKYKGKTFKSYSLEYSRFLGGILPANFVESKMFDNKYLILQVANYFYRQDKDS